MSAKGAFGFVAGGILGAAAGVVAGILLAPRSGAESRAMAADAMNDAWDTAVDSYERGSRVVSEKIGSRPGMDVTAEDSGALSFSFGPAFRPERRAWVKAVPPYIRGFATLQMFIPPAESP